MKLQVKSALIIIGTLIIGMILGGLISGMIRNQIHGKLAEGPPSNRFARMMTRIIQPDESQVDELQAVMDLYSPRFSDQHSRHQGEMKVLIDSLHSDLAPILTEEQMDRLLKRMERFSHRFGGRGKRGGPQGGPPQGGPHPGEGH